ncbi:MAG TPA: hypothetical protein VHP34_08490, partial [Alphaproteobacteria bacterium]|nr:hypothetical protein [Alphaproteobacteria bacterium]
AEAKKPETDDDVAFVGASGSTDAPEKKKDITAEQASFQANPADAEAKKEGVDLNFAEHKGRQQDEQKDEQKQDPEQEADGPAEEARIPTISREHMELLNQAWGVGRITKALDETLQGARIKYDDSINENGGGVLTFKLSNNHQIQWFQEFEGIESYVGFPKNRKMDDLDAKMVVATLASMGKKEIKLYGDRESKEKMWLEAMRQGLGVTNFQPIPSDDPNSVYQKWLRESQDMKTGASADTQAPSQEIEADKPEVTAETPAEPAAETAEAETPAEPAAETAEAETPAEPAAETAEAETPADDKPAAEDKGGLKSSFLADKPAADEVKVDTPAEEKPAVTEEKPAAVKSSFLGDTTTDKKDDAPAPKGPEMPNNETFEETLDRRIKQAKNPEIEAALRTLKADYKSGALKLDDIDREMVQRKLGGDKPLTAAKVNAAIGYVSSKPDNKDVVLPTVPDDQKPQSPQQKLKNPGLG